MGQGIIVAILSILFYLSGLLGGTQQQPPLPNPTWEAQSLTSLGQTAQIVGSKVIVRQGPHSEEEPVGTVQQGWRVTVLDQKADWLKIHYAPGLEGWIPAYYLELVSPDEISPKAANRIVLGYYSLDNPAYESLLAHKEYLTAIAPQCWRLDGYGGLVADFAGENLGKNLSLAGNQGLQTYALIQINSEPTKLFHNDFLQEKTASAILDTLQEWGLRGVQLDLNYSLEEPEKFAEFLQRLQSKLAPQGLKTLLALPLGEDYGSFSGNVDYLVVKAYLPAKKGEPGPAAPASWVEENLQQALNQVPKEKIILGIAASGRDWSSLGLPQSLSYQEVLDLAARQGASIKWDGQAKTPYFQYGAGRQVWFENRYSLKYKLELAQHYDLAGIAVLNLGQEDPGLWNTLAGLF